MDKGSTSVGVGKGAVGNEQEMAEPWLDCYRDARCLITLEPISSSRYKLQAGNESKNLTCGVAPKVTGLKILIL